MDLKARALADAENGLLQAQAQRDLLNDVRFDRVQEWCQEQCTPELSEPLSEYLLEILVAYKRHMGEDILPLWIVPAGKLSIGILKKRPHLSHLIEQANRTSTVKALFNPGAKRMREDS